MVQDKSGHVRTRANQIITRLFSFIITKVENRCHILNTFFDVAPAQLDPLLQTLLSRVERQREQVRRPRPQHPLPHALDLDHAAHGHPCQFVIDLGDEEEVIRREVGGIDRVLHHPDLLRGHEDEVGSYLSTYASSCVNTTLRPFWLAFFADMD